MKNDGYDGPIDRFVSKYLASIDRDELEEWSSWLVALKIIISLVLLCAFFNIRVL